jgi:hypothetical protein
MALHGLLQGQLYLHLNKQEILEEVEESVVNGCDVPCVDIWHNKLTVTNMDAVVVVVFIGAGRVLFVNWLEKFSDIPITIQQLSTIMFTASKLPKVATR